MNSTFLPMKLNPIMDKRSGFKEFGALIANEVKAATAEFIKKTVEGVRGDDEETKFPAKSGGMENRNG